MSATILVVDDDPMSAKLVKDVCTHAGYEVLTACDGKQGVALAQQRKPALILLDVMMPVMDGYTALNEIRVAANTRDIPVVMLTAVAFDLNRKMALNAGANDYLTKPVDVDLLLTKVKKFVPGPA